MKKKLLLVFLLFAFTFVSTSTGGLFDSATQMAGKLEEMQQRRTDNVNIQTEKLDQKVEEIISLIGENPALAMFKAKSVRWTAVGDQAVDDEQTAHYDEIRSELIAMINGEKNEVKAYRIRFPDSEASYIFECKDPSHLQSFLSQLKEHTPCTVEEVPRDKIHDDPAMGKIILSR